MKGLAPDTTYTWGSPRAADSIPRCFDWSPDGISVCIGDSNATVTVIGVEGFAAWTELKLRETRSVRAIRWSPDGQLLAAATDEDEVYVISVSAERLAAIYHFGALGASHMVAWSPLDPRCLGWGSTRTGAIVQLPSGHPLHTFDAFSIAWSPDGKSIAVGQNDGTICLRDGVNGADLGRFSVGAGPVQAIAWNRDGRLAVVRDRTLQVFGTVREALPLYSCSGHAGLIQSVSWSGDGRMLATASVDRTLRLWSSDDGHELARLDHQGIVWEAAFSPGGKWLMSVCEDSRLRLWRVADIALERPAGPQGLAGYAARQALTVGRSVRALPVVRLGGGTLVSRFEGSNQEGFPHGGFTADERIVSGHVDGKVRCWSVGESKPIWSFDAGSPIHAIDSSPVNGTIAVATRSSITIRLPVTGEVPERIDEHIANVNDVRWAFDRLALASASSDGRVIISSMVGDRPSIALRHGAPVYSVAWSPDDSRIVSGLGKAINVWEVSTSNLVWNIPLPRFGTFWCVRWSPDGQRIAAVFGDSLKVWAAGLSTEPILSCHHDGVISNLAWSPDGRMIATTSYDRTICLWDAATGKELQRFTPEDGHHRGVSWSPDGTMLATCGPSDSISVWRLNDAVAFVPEEFGSARRRAIDPLLPSALAQLHRLQIHPPLSLLQSVLQLTGGRAPEEPALERVARAEGMRALVALRWPSPARVGFAALLLHHIPLEGWEPPSGTQPAQARDALIGALAVGNAVEPQSPVMPSEALVEAAHRIDDRLLTLLEIIGPKAVAQDPGLPLRLLSRLPQIRPLHFAQRQRLGLRTPIGSSGRASGSGLGGERGGFDLRGDLRALLSSQLVLPSEVLRFRHLRGELLYRAKLGQEPPQLRPTVLVLDVSPPSFGPIESVTRLATHILGSTLLEAGIRAVLVTSGGTELVRVLERADDLVDVWTHRTYEMADATRTFRIARAMREQIGGSGLEPIILVLSHAWFAAEEDLTAVPGLRGLFVQYPQHHVSPALARHCERWESLHPAESDRVSNLLGKLLG